MRQVHTVTIVAIVLVHYHALLFKLLLLDMDCNCMRTGFEVHACTVSSPNVKQKSLFHKLIRVTRIFMRKNFVLQCHPQSILNIELFPNYGI